MYEQFSWREKRCNLKSIPLFPYYFDTKQTTLPEGNAHYSMYGLRKADAMQYESLLTKKHAIYEHYSSELIVDVETEEGLRQVLAVCRDKDWSYKLYDTGSDKTGGHVAIERHAVPSEILYARDHYFIWHYFEGIPDIDESIYKPMHLIRGIGRVNEKTKRLKRVVEGYNGCIVPSVLDLNLPEILQKRHERIKYDIKTSFDTNWTKFQRCINRNNPTGIKKGRRYISYFAFARDLAKSGLKYDVALELAYFFNKDLEEPDDVFDVERAVKDAYKSVRRDTE